MTKLLSTIKQSLAVTITLALTFTSGISPASRLHAAPLPSLSGTFPTPPETLGFLAERHLGKNDRHIILIQDLHAHLDTQKKIAGLLHFYESNGLLQRPIGLEGASGTWDLSIWNNIPLKERKQAFYDYLLEEAGLTGPEWFALNTQRPTLLKGIDSPADFTAQRALYVQSRGAREVAAQQLGTVLDALKVMSKRDLTGHALEKWQHLTQDFEAGKLQADLYLRHMNEISGTLHLAAQGETLRTALNAGSATEIAQLSTSDRFYSDVRKFGQQVGLALASPSQQNLIKALYAAELLKRMMRQQMTLEEIKQVGSRPQEMAELTHQLIESSGESSWFDTKGLLELVRICTDFYVAALVRDEPMAENTLRLFAEPAFAKTSSSNLPETVILVSGGFHTAGLMEAFRNAGVSYDVITPNITAQYTADDEKRYADRMAGNPVSLTRFNQQVSVFSKGTESEIRTPQSKTANSLEVEKVNPDDFKSMFGADSLWIKQYKENLAFRNGTPELGYFPTLNYWSAFRALGLQKSTSGLAEAFGKAFKSLPAKLLPPTYRRLESIEIYTGLTNPEELGHINMESVRDDRLYANDINDNTGGLIGYIHENSLRPAEDFLEGGRYATFESGQLITNVFRFHESVEGRIDLDVRADGKPVEHQDLEAYGATLAGVLHSLRNGNETPFLRRVKKDLEIDWQVAIQPEVQIWRQFRNQPGLFTDELQKAGDDLVEIGQAHLFSDWNRQDITDAYRSATLRDALRVMQSYPGGLKQFGSDLNRILGNLKTGTTRFTGLVPIPAQTERVDASKEIPNSGSNYRQLEDAGMDAIADSAIVLVAGGLGQRLGYPGAKIGIPLALVTDDEYIDIYRKMILGWQHKSNAQHGTHKEIPLFILTSDETDDATVKLLKDRGYQIESTRAAAGRDATYWSLNESKIITVRQNMVPAVWKTGLFDKKADGSLQMQPPGHGDVHVVLNQFGFLNEWQLQGRKSVIFIQDTNAMSRNAVLPALGLKTREKAGMTYVAIPRQAGDKVGLNSDLIPHHVITHVLESYGLGSFNVKQDLNLYDFLRAHGRDVDVFLKDIRTATGKFSTENVEYPLANDALKEAVSINGDFVDSVLGISPFPGNINILIVDLDAYQRALSKSGGLMPQLINFKTPKPGEPEKPARLESGMQDLGKDIGELGERVNVFADANVGGFIFSTVKNSLRDGLLAQEKGNIQETVSSGESDYYQSFRRFLSLAGVAINVLGTPLTIAGIHVRDGAKVVLGAEFAPTSGALLERVHGGRISDVSTLVIDGPSIEMSNLDLDGGLEIITGPGVIFKIDNARVHNSAYDEIVPLAAGSVAAPYLTARGYEIKRQYPKSFRRIHISTPGQYRLIGEDGHLEKFENGWHPIPDVLESAPLPVEKKPLLSVRSIARLLGIAGLAASFFCPAAYLAHLGVSSIFFGHAMPSLSLGWALFGLVFALPQAQKIFGSGNAEYSGSNGEITNAHAAYQRVHEVSHSISGYFLGSSTTKAREVTDEILAELVIGPLLGWALALSTALGWASGKFDAWISGEEREMTPQMQQRIDSLSAFISSGHAYVADISVGRVVTDKEALLPSSMGAHIWGYLVTAHMRQNQLAYRKAQERIAESA